MRVMDAAAESVEHLDLHYEGMGVQFLGFNSLGGRGRGRFL